MDRPSFASMANLSLIEAFKAQYDTDPTQLDPTWRAFFEGLEIGRGQPTVGMDAVAYTYRTYGHLQAHFNPLSPPRERVIEEDNPSLKATYCGTIGFEYMGLGRPEMEAWLQAEIEPLRGVWPTSPEEKRRFLHDLNAAELFELFLHTKYVGQKRFSLEGGETLIPLLHTLIEMGGELGVEEFGLGMAHRGRLNVLVNVLGKSYANIFHEFQDTPGLTVLGSGDVKYHKGFSSDRVTTAGKVVHLSLMANPSHLEAVDPVVTGQVRAKQVKRGDDTTCTRVVPILIHGDASVAGQGIVYELMQLSRVQGYGVGGTIHIVVNNQIGFTTTPSEGRSTRYCTDIAKAFGAPVFHVNGDDPEGVCYAGKLALEIRQRFGCDVFIDLNCFRKYGHNEADEPAFTQPHLYAHIRSRKSPREIYRDHLIAGGVIEHAIAATLEAEYTAELQAELEVVQSLKTEPEKVPLPAVWEGIGEANHQEDPFAKVATGVPVDTLRKLGEVIGTLPAGFALHRKMERLVEERRQMVAGAPSERLINWGMAEQLALAALLAEGHPVRLSGQDARRGTFNHRHGVFVDQATEERYCPLSALGRCDILNSPLSEYAVLGFEYGYSLATPEGFVAWEAQFGDFANTAQVIIDQFISSAEQKWGRYSGLTLLLPHGYEGQGPEHSSAREERYLRLASDNNLRIVNVTTPAQIFHALRRQVLSVSRRPLIVFTPKQLFGHPGVVSSLDELAKGQFHTVIDDETPPTRAEQLVLCSGHVYYDVLAEREKRGDKTTAIIRLEQLYPFDKEALWNVLQRYGKVQRTIYLQEEPVNMGPWTFLGPLLRPMGDWQLVGRPSSSSPATGSPRQHKAQLQTLMDTLFGKAT